MRVTISGEMQATRKSTTWKLQCHSGPFNSVTLHFFEEFWETLQLLGTPLDHPQKYLKQGIFLWCESRFCFISALCFRLLIGVDVRSVGTTDSASRRSHDHIALENNKVSTIKWRPQTRDIRPFSLRSIIQFEAWNAVKMYYFLWESIRFKAINRKNTSFFEPLLEIYIFFVLLVIEHRFEADPCVLKRPCSKKMWRWCHLPSYKKECDPAAWGENDLERDSQLPCAKSHLVDTKREGRVLPCTMLEGAALVRSNWFFLTKSCYVRCK